MGLLDSNKRIVSLSSASGAMTATFTTGKTLTTILNPKHQRYLMLDVEVSGFTISQNWGFYLYDIVDNSQSGVFCEKNGEVYTSIPRNGNYVLDTAGFDVVLRIDGGDSSSKSITINYAFTDSAPHASNCKPIQKLYSDNVTLVNGTTIYNLVNNIGSGYNRTIKLFKYYIIRIACTDSSDNLINQTFSVNVGWRNKFEGKTAKVTLFEDIAQVSEKNGYVSEMLPVTGEELSVNVTVDSVVDGNKFFVNIYGVR